MDGYGSGPASLFSIAARSPKRNLALEACEKLVEAIGECQDCEGRGKIHGDGCGRCGGIGLVIDSVGMIMSEALPLAVDALDADNKPFADSLRKLFRGGDAHWVGMKK
jgi:hypothetical protein